MRAMKALVLERDEHVIAVRPHQANAMRTEVDEDGNRHEEPLTHRASARPACSPTRRTRLAYFTTWIGTWAITVRSPWSCT